jgi:LysR substrate binding domain-containing protein
MEKATSVTVNGRMVVTFNQVGLAAAVAGLGLVSMTVGAARKEIAEDQLMRVLADWDMGEAELQAVFPARKAAKPSAPAFVDLLASSTIMIFPSVALALRVPSEPAALALIDPRAPPQRVKPGKSLQIAAKKNEDQRPPHPAKGRLAFPWQWSTISRGWREAARVAHEELDPPTSSRRPTSESDRWCSSR